MASIDLSFVHVPTLPRIARVTSGHHAHPSDGHSQVHVEHAKSTKKRKLNRSRRQRNYRRRNYKKNRTLKQRGGGDKSFEYVSEELEELEFFYDTSKIPIPIPKINIDYLDPQMKHGEIFISKSKNENYFIVLCVETNLYGKEGKFFNCYLSKVGDVKHIHIQKQVIKKVKNDLSDILEQIERCIIHLAEEKGKIIHIGNGPGKSKLTPYKTPYETKKIKYEPVADE